MKRLATIQRDGVVEFDIGRSARLAKDLFGSDVMEDNDESLFATCERLSRERQAEEDEEGHEQQIPPLKIVILIVGTRGDVQPFIAIGKKLQVLILCTFLLVPRVQIFLPSFCLFGFFSYSRLLLSV